MPTRHVALALLVAVAWGVNFVAIDFSLDTFPPMFLVALRFAVIAIPTVLFIPRPDVPLRWLIGYGVGFGVLQFAFVYWGMAIGMPAGLASLVLQASAPFTVVLSAILLRERLTGVQVTGILIAVAGLAVVGWQRAEHAAVAPFLLTLAGAFGWAIGNVSNRRALQDPGASSGPSRSSSAPSRPSSGVERPFRLMMWMTVIPPLPMLVVSLIVEGPSEIGESMRAAGTLDGLPAVVGVIFTAVVATIGGSGAWTWLMSIHPASVVAPFSMLVPVVGMTTAWVVLGQSVRPMEIAGALLVVGGVLFGTIRLSRGAQRADGGGEPEHGDADRGHDRDVERATANL
ncbi:hypothetical protein nbrc107696_24070 [Gordonia spumicola]|uniref:EamA domain-containing protein n=1 Tax=Gordonia spumicola TaxID=589161 RepID=A0A7I9VA32_9ACTN|nr:EamA family transporter [Gordonia spumicola]GEE01961.1 hypothetical protein nbrc107696_24070 [Gordonia spumicola]